MPFAPPFEAYVAPARLRPALWRLPLGLVTILAVYLFWLIALGGALALLGSGPPLRAWLARMVAGASPVPLLLLLLSFGGLALGAVVAARLWHRRGAATLMGRAPVVLRDFSRATVAVWAVYALILGPTLWAMEIRPGLEFAVWLWLLPLSLAAIALQTLAEEMVFRGYLMQQLAARFETPWVWMLLPALAFGAVHYDPDLGALNAWIVIATITLFALVAADLTRRTGSLGAAWGVHFANNCVALLVVSDDQNLTGLALWQSTFGGDDPRMALSLALDVLAMLAVWGLLRRSLRR